MADKENTIGVNNPHDKVFRKTYRDFDNACSLISNGLPQRVVKLQSGSDPDK